MMSKHEYITYTSGQKTRHQKLNSYLVMNSLGTVLNEHSSTPSTTASEHKCEDREYDDAVMASS